MESKSEITQEYINMIKKVETQVQTYEGNVIALQKKLGSLSAGNYGIDEIKEEINSIRSTISKLDSECEWARKTILENEYKY